MPRTSECQVNGAVDMFLLRDRKLNIAILVSLSCHVLFMFSIAPVIMPSGIKGNYGPISFLGSILEDVMPRPEKTLSLDKVYFMRTIEKMGAYDSKGVILRDPQIAPKSKIADADKIKFIPSVRKGILALFNLHHKEKKRYRIEFSDIWITGKAKHRAILYKPPLPRTLILNSEFDMNHETVVKFGISRHGFVENPECVISSGSSEIDQMAIRYMRKWQFVPYNEEAYVAQEGSVHIKFNSY